MSVTNTFGGYVPKVASPVQYLQNIMKYPWQNANLVGGVQGVNTTAPATNQQVTTPTYTNPVQNSNPAPQQQGADWGSIYRSQYPGWGETEAMADWKVKGSPTSFGNSGGGSDTSMFDEAYAGYLSQLDSVLNNNLPAQRTSQENVVNNSYGQSVNDLNVQQTQNLQTLDNQRTQATANQGKSLKDLSSNLRNMFVAGNNYLGARGASDSSASNQYSYALTKLANQQRGDINSQTNTILNDISTRESNLKQTYGNELKRLDTEKGNKLEQIATWFYEQQNSLVGQKANVQAQKAQAILNYAIEQLNTVKTEEANKRLMLDQWAMNNSKTIDQLKTNLDQSQTTYNYPKQTPIAGNPVITSAGDFVQQPGYGYGTQQEDKPAVGSPEWFKSYYGF